MKLRNFFISGLVGMSLFQPLCADELVIMHTNDVHGNIVPEKSKYAGGIARRKVVIDSIRKAEKHSLLVDAGDGVQGFLYFTAFGGEVEYKAMQLLGYDLAIPGNHEFDVGMENLAKNYKLFKATKLNANYDVRNTPLRKLLKPYVIKKYSGKKIAFIGIGCQPEGMIPPQLREGMGYKNGAVVADSIATELKRKGKADYVVVLSHIGYQPGKVGLPSDSVMALESENIDLIIGGHSHTVINPKSSKTRQYLFKNKVGKNVVVAQSGSNGEWLGKITVDLDNLDAVPSSELLPIDSRYDGKTDPAVAEWLKPYDAEVEKLKSIVVGESAAEYPDHGTNPLSNWVADKIYQIASSATSEHIDFAIGNKGGIRKPMPKGEVTLGLVLTMLPFENYVTVIKLDGKSVYDAFDVMVGRGGDAVSSHIKACAVNNKTTEVLLNGEPIDPAKTYTIATLNYLSEGGDNMEPLTRGEMIAKTDRSLKYDILDIIKEMTARGEIIDPDTTERMIIK